MIQVGTNFPMQLRLHAWRGQRWRAFLRRMNSCMATIMEEAKSCPRIMPVARHVQDRTALMLYCAREPDDPNVVLFKKLKQARVVFLAQCIEEVVGQCAIEAGKWARHVVDRSYSQHSLWMADMRTVVFGNIILKGVVQRVWCK